MKAEAPDRASSWLWLALAGYPAVVTRWTQTAFNPDELLFLLTARQPSFGEVWRHSLAHAHPPGNFLLLHLMLGVSNDPLWLQFPSMICGMASFCLTWLLVRRLAGGMAGLAAAVLTAYSLNLVLLAGTVRNYPALWVFVLALMLFAVRFLQEPKPRFAVLAGLFSALAISWHYAAIIPILAANLIVIAGGLKHPLPARAVFGFIAAQIPCALLMGFFYLTHISKMDPAVIATANDVMKLETGFPASAPLFPLIQLHRFLVAPRLGEAAFIFSLMASFALLFHRRRLALLVFGMPILLAWAFSAARLLPLGATRQSSYLFPFVFGLVGCGIAQIARNARLEGHEFDGLPPGSRKTFRFLWEGQARPLAEVESEAYASPLQRFLFLALVATVAVGGVLYNFHIWSETRSARHARASVEPFAVDSPLKEFPMEQWEMEELARALSNASPGDVVLMSHQTSIVLGYYMFEGPMEFAPDRPLRRDRRGVKFVYSTEGYWDFTEETLGRAIEEVKRDYPAARRIWIPQTGWEVWREPHAEMLKRMYPRFQADLDAASHAGDLLAVAPREAFEPPFPPEPRP